MATLVREIVRYHELIWELAIKELRVRYKRSLLGFFWALLHPLLMMVVLSVVFSQVMRVPVPHYSIFLISALLPWTFFSQALSYSVESIVANGELLKKVYVPKSVFPLSAVLANIINFLLSLVPLVGLLLVLRFPFHWTWVYLPVPLLGLLLFTIGFGLFFAAANVFFRDLSHILQVLLAAWFYLSPVIYSAEFIPSRYRPVARLNPMSYSLDGFRDAIYYGRIPAWQSTALTLAIGVVALWIGYAFFRRVQHTLVLYV
jgi:ABC-2 type transport system permease protein